MRLIDAVTLKAEFTGNFQTEYSAAQIRATIDAAPTVDAVEVVRCRDCEYAEMNGFGDYKILRGCPVFYACEVTDPDAYCSEGKRREVKP